MKFMNLAQKGRVCDDVEELSKYVREDMKDSLIYALRILYDTEIMSPEVPSIPDWIEIKNKYGTVIALRCPHCGGSPKHAARSKFCPNCGHIIGV